VTKVTPGADGRIIHTVKHGQTLWAIAIAYGTHILDIQRANGMTADQVDLSEGQQLVIPAAGDQETGVTVTPIPPLPSSTPFLPTNNPGSTPTVMESLSVDNEQSGEQTIIIIAVIAALGLIGFGLFISRQEKD
jgi:LysM repeat protein